MRSDYDVLAYNSHIIRNVREKVSYNTKFYVLLMVFIVFIGTILSTPVLSLLTRSVSIRSSGTIVANISPLHVDGRYIKNSFNQTVWLRGVNKNSLEDDPDGFWMSSTMWSDANVKAELDAMKSWGINVIRCHFSVELWKYNIGPNSGHPASPYCKISAREAMKRLVQFAAEKGIYVIYDAYSVGCYYTGGAPDPLPFPPYQTSANASSIIANVSEFVDFWRSIAREFRSYPNVIFEIWNEPRNKSGSNKTEVEAFMDWINAWNLCVKAIREEGATQPVIFQWGMDVYCNLYENTQTGEIYASGGVHIRQWLGNAIGNLTDPLNNIVYSTHMYRVYGGTGLYKYSAQEKYGYWGWVYDHIRTAFIYMGFVWAQETMNVPLFIGETGCDLAFKDIEYIRELAAWNNTLSLFHEWGIHYAAFWWHSIGIFRLHTGAPNFSPNEAGQILRRYLSGSQHGE